MQVYDDLPKIPQQRSSIVTLGNFDGVHLGHQHLIRSMVTQAHQKGSRSVLITFSPHPRELFAGCSGFYLTSDGERLRLFEQMGVQTVVLLEFTKELMEMPANTFVDELITKLGMQELWIGYDFAMGYQRRGDAAYLSQLAKERGFCLHVTPPVQLDGRPISSSRIRTGLQDGDIQEVNACLGRNYQIRGLVRDFGFTGPEKALAIASVKVGAKKAVPSRCQIPCRVVIENSGYDKAVLFGGKGYANNGDQILRLIIPGCPNDLAWKEITLELNAPIVSSRCCPLDIIDDKINPTRYARRRTCNLSTAAPELP